MKAYFLVYQYFIYIYCSVIFHCMGVAQFMIYRLILICFETTSEIIPNALAQARRGNNSEWGGGHSV